MYVKTWKVDEIRRKKPYGKFTLESGKQSGIRFENGVFFSTFSSREQDMLKEKLIGMGYVLDRNFTTDEEAGLSNASDAFEFKIIEG